MDNVNRIDLADSFRLLQKISDEAATLLEQIRLREAVVWNILEQQMESREPAEKIIESIVEKGLANDPMQ